MTKIFAAACMLASMVCAPAMADDHPVVIELYTSQGCSSCPPADALLHELARRDDVLPLALHVDYWDYIGWKDEFADPMHTKRQRGYARAAGDRTIYTPQMIVGGMDHVIGYKPMRLAELIEAHHDKPQSVMLDLTRAGETVSITLSAAKPVGAAIVQLVRYSPSETVDVRRGENAGRVLSYANVVTEWRMLGEWSGAEPLSLDADAPGDAPVVVLVQMPNHGPILAAARLR